MALSAATNVAVAGHAGALAVRRAYSTTGRSLPVIARFAVIDPCPQGAPSIILSRWGSAVSAASVAESAAAATPTTQPTMGSVTLTPAGGRASMAITSEGQNRTIPENDVMARQDFEVGYAVSRYASIDTTTGLTYQLSQFSASGGNSGSTLTVAGILNRAAVVWNAINDDTVHLVALIDGKGRDDLETEMRSSGNSYLTNIALEPWVQSLWAKSPFARENGYYATCGGGRVHIFVERTRDALIQSGGDRIGGVFVPYLPGLNGVPLDGMSDQQDAVAPALALTYREMPTIAADDTTDRRKVIQTPTGPASVLRRSYAGTNDRYVDAWISVGSGILSQSSGTQLLYVA